MIGIGVGIDYALLIVTRHRAALSRGATVLDAIDEAMRTAGRSVVFAGVTVMISLLGLLLVRLSFLDGPRVGHCDRSGRCGRRRDHAAPARCSRSSAPASTSCTSAVAGARTGRP